jgi:hypothetical protein
MAFGYNVEIDGFDSDDLTELADHILCAGIKEIDFAHTPHPILWAVCDAGGLASLTFRPKQKVFAWARQAVGGSFLGSENAIIESLAVSSEPAYDQLWIVAKRTINGATKRYVEFMEDPFRILDPEMGIEESFFMDSALTLDGADAADPQAIEGATMANPVKITITGHTYLDGDEIRITKVKGMTELNGRTFTVANATANDFTIGVDGTGYAPYHQGGECRKKTDTIPGGAHLAGETVQILADGAPKPDQVMPAGGTLTLPAKASHVHIGLYRKAIYQSLDLDTPDPEQSSMGKQRRFAIANVRFLDTVGMDIGDQNGLLVPVLFRKGSDPMNEPPPLFKGIKKVSLPSSWDHEAILRIEQPQPFPMTVTAIALIGKGGAR